MSRPACLLAVLALAVAACEGGASKAKEVGQKIDDVATGLDESEAKGHLAAARQAFAAGKEAPEACSWASSSAATSVAASARASVDALRALCAVEVPLQRATRAVTMAETARAEQPQAPTLTECQSETWSQAAAVLDRDHAAEPRWTELKARWVKTCAAT
jgi:hypothetical protein